VEIGARGGQWRWRSARGSGTKDGMSGGRGGRRKMKERKRRKKGPRREEEEGKGNK
jgi:hypothetical protein